MPPKDHVVRSRSPLNTQWNTGRCNKRAPRVEIPPLSHTHNCFSVKISCQKILALFTVISLAKGQWHKSCTSAFQLCKKERFWKKNLCLPPHTYKLLLLISLLPLRTLPTEWGRVYGMHLLIKSMKGRLGKKAMPARNQCSISWKATPCTFFGMCVSLLRPESLLV